MYILINKITLLEPFLGIDNYFGMFLTIEILMTSVQFFQERQHIKQRNLIM